MFVDPPLFVYSMTDFPPEARNSLKVLSRCSRIPAKVSTAESYASFCTPSADICSKISFFHLFLVTSCTPFVKNLPRVGKSYPRRSLPDPEGASDEGGDLCGLSYPVPPRVLRFLRMHFVVARLTQADEIGCVIRKFRMLVRVLDVVHGRRLTAPPIPQAMSAHIPVTSQHSRAQPPPSRCIVVKAHGPISESPHATRFLASRRYASRHSISRAMLNAYGHTTRSHKCLPVLRKASYSHTVGYGQLIVLFMARPPFEKKKRDKRLLASLYIFSDYIIPHV